MNISHGSVKLFVIYRKFIFVKYRLQNLPVKVHFADNY